MHALDHSLYSRRVLTPEGTIAAAVRITDRRIAAVTPADRAPAGALDLGDRWLLPGLVDTHVHVNEPGRTEWEGFETASRAAAAGGVTTLVDMPLNAIPATTRADALALKSHAALAALVHVGFWGGLVPGNAGELAALAHAGARGFKCFLVPSGVDEFPPVGEADLRAALPALARLGLPLLVHAERPGPIAAAAEVVRGRDPRAYATWLDSRPPEAEVEAVRLVVGLAAEAGIAVHIVHVAAAEVLPVVREARARGVRVTAETCPHYLTFTARDVPDGATEFTCAPPIRTRAHREALWAGLRDGTLDLIASDHSPCPPAMKARERGDFFAAWGGIASLELGLSAVWTEAAARGVALADVVRWMSAAPAALAGFGAVRGAIAAGRDADLIAFDPEATWTVDPARLHQRHPVTPYAGRTLRGRVERTWVEGVLVYDRARGFEPDFAPEPGPRRA